MLRPAITALIAHTQRDVVDLLAEKLQAEACLVMAASCGKEALELLGKHDFQVVLVEQRLPDISGAELKRAVVDRHPLLPVIVLENFKSIRTSEDMMRFGTSDFIMDAAELIDLSQRLAGGRVRIDDRLYAQPELQNFLTNLILTFTEMVGRVVPAFGPNQADKREVAVDVARRMGLPERTVHDVGIAALLYDVGKVKISEFLLSKEQELSHDEELNLHNHCHWSLQILERLGLPERIQQIVLHHHENYDGTGYPQKLSGRGIPIGSRIITAVDSFFAMIAPRAYREPRSEKDALQELMRAAGTQFDPEVVEHFVKSIEERYHQQGEVFRKDIAVIDDDQGALELLRYNFEREGYTVRLFHKAAEALEKLPQSPPSLVLSDVVMPDMTGFQFLEKLRSHASLRTVPFIFISGSRLDEFDKVKGLDLGADDYLVKPIRVNELNSRVRALLRRAGGDDAPERRTQGIVGNLRDFPLTDIIQLLHQGRKTAVVEVRKGKSKGEVFQKGGNVVHVEISGPGATSGMKAFKTILRWGDSDFVIRHGVKTDQKTIELETSQLVLESLMELDHQGIGITRERKQREVVTRPLSAGPAPGGAGS
ncbi:MAG: response regulator [Acidobacteriota bacterium]